MRATLGILALAIALSTPARTQTTSQAQAQAQSMNTMGPTLCDRGVISDADVAAILGAPIVRHTGSNAHVCRFTTADRLSLSVTWQPGRGNLAIAQWSARSDLYGSTPVGGIGDRALWLAKQRELSATKDDVLCDVSSDHAKGADADLQRLYGALCAKVWTLK